MLTEKGNAILGQARGQVNAKVLPDKLGGDNA
jgi:hypothetical protein